LVFHYIARSCMFNTNYYAVTGKKKKKNYITKMGASCRSVLAPAALRHVIK